MGTRIGVTIGLVVLVICLLLPVIKEYNNKLLIDCMKKGGMVRFDDVTKSDGWWTCIKY